eukprot:TRINITY_DN8681_c0_g1_i7.p1 TRINITY_DN8681_c0_g1~~TRINITY_DN8681_c0_g1_i7.p1  ORF type:complete len:248 (+),score=43.01 TRINITY_DN8681_c0_g1_i7:477-1220(+)
MGAGCCGVAHEADDANNNNPHHFRGGSHKNGTNGRRGSNAARRRRRSSANFGQTDGSEDGDSGNGGPRLDEATAHKMRTHYTSLLRWNDETGLPELMKQKSTSTKMLSPPSTITKRDVHYLYRDGVREMEEDAYLDHYNGDASTAWWNRRRSCRPPRNSSNGASRLKKNNQTSSPNDNDNDGGSNDVDAYHLSHSSSSSSVDLSLIHISEPTRLLSISYAVFCLKKKKKKKRHSNHPQHIKNTQTVR